MAFFIIWCIRETWLVQYLEMMDSVPKALTSAAIKIIIWIIPVILLVKVMENSNPFSYLGFRNHVKSGLKWAGWIALILLSYLVLNIFLNKTITFQLELHEWLNVVLLAGITEETVFRGFMLRKLMDSFRFWKANIITAFLFVSIHFPIWFYKGLFEFPYILNSILTTFVLSLIFGFIFMKSKSLWSVVIIHSLYNLLVLIIY